MHGLGGIGKTQLAIEYVYRNQHLYPVIFWFPSEETSQLDNAYQKVAHKLRIDTEQPIEIIIANVIVWFHKHPYCLLVYDNAPNADAIEKYLPKTGSYILITSRTTNWNWLGHSITVDGFTEEAQQYILRALGNRNDSDDVNELAEQLGYLPLALAQAAAYIIKNKLTAAKYLELLYDQNKQKLLADDALPKFQHEPVFLTWDITMKAIFEESQLAAELLISCAYLHSDDIP